MQSSTGGCTRTSFAGFASRAKRWGSARFSPARSFAPRTAPMSSAMRPRQAAVRSRSETKPSAREALRRVRAGKTAPCHRAVVERLVEDRFLDAAIARDLPDGAPGRSGLLHDLARQVVADVRVQRRRCRESQLGVALERLAVRVDA